ncbi:hypothetical protein [Burkholderia glumae]
MNENTTAPALTDEQRAAINMAISVLTPLAMDEYGDALRSLLTSPRAAVPLQLTDSEKASIDRLTAIVCSFPEHIGPSGAWSRVNHGDLGAVVSIAKRALDAAPTAPVAEPMLKAPEGEDPMADGQNTVESGLKRLRAAYCKQQPAPIPDQMALVWRADVMRLALDYGRLATLVKKHIPDAHIAAPSAAQAVAADGAQLTDSEILAKAKDRVYSRPFAEVEYYDFNEKELISFARDLLGGRAAVSPATAEPREAGHGIKGIPRAAFGPHTEADRIDHCGSCGAENEPQKDDVCPVCHAECSLVSTWGEFQHTRYRNGQRYANNGPQPWEDGPQPATAEPCAHDYVRPDRACTECGEKTATADERAALDMALKLRAAGVAGTAVGDMLHAAAAMIEARASQAAAPAEAIDRYQAVCAAAYQLAGVVGAPLRFLDALSDAANGEPMSADEALNLLPVGLNEIDEVNRSASAPADAREPVAQWQTRVRAAKTAAWVNVTEEDAKHVMSELPEAYEVRALYERPEPADAGEAVSSFIRDVAAQKPVLGSSCGLCDSNRNRAQDLLKAAQGVQGGKGGEA